MENNEVLVKNEVQKVEDLFPQLSGEITKEVIANPEFDKQFALLIDLEKFIKDKMAFVKDGLKSIAEQEYSSSGDNKIESKSYNVTYKPSYTRDGLDNDKLAEKYPEAYKDCQKVTVCSSSITVKRKRG